MFVCFYHIFSPRRWDLGGEFSNLLIISLFSFPIRQVKHPRILLSHLQSSNHFHYSMNQTIFPIYKFIYKHFSSLWTTFLYLLNIIFTNQVSAHHLYNDINQTFRRWLCTNTIDFQMTTFQFTSTCRSQCNELKTS